MSTATCSAAGSWRRSTSPARCRPRAAPMAASPPSPSIPSCSSSRVFVGDLLSFYADIVKVGKTSITVYVEVYAERNRLQGGMVKVTEATLTYVATGDGPQAAPAAARVEVAELSLVTRWTRSAGCSCSAPPASPPSALRPRPAPRRCGAPCTRRWLSVSAWAWPPARRCPTPSMLWTRILSDPLQRGSRRRRWPLHGALGSGATTRPSGASSPAAAPAPCPSWRTACTWT